MDRGRSPRCSPSGRFPLVWDPLTHVVLARLFSRMAPQIVAVGAGLAGALPTALLAGTLAVPGLLALVRMPVAVTPHRRSTPACIAYSTSTSST